MLCGAQPVFSVFALRLNLLSFRDPREGGCAGTLASVAWFNFLRFLALGSQQEHSSQSMPPGHHDANTGLKLATPAAGG